MIHFFSIKAYAVFLSRNKLFTAVNIFGFSISLIFVTLFGLYIQQELSMDSWHSKEDRIYRLSHDDGAVWAAPIAEDLINRYSEIEQVVRMYDREFTFTAKQQDYTAILETLVVDSNFFSVFDFRLIDGNKKTALELPTNALLSQSFAQMLFGEQSPIGKIVTIADSEFVISGVFEDLKNTTIKQTNIILPLSAIPTLIHNKLDNYRSCNYTFFVLESKNADLLAKVDDMTAYFKQNFWLFRDGYANEVIITPLRDVHFMVLNYNMAITTNNMSFILILITTALLILLFAVINYINLSIAQSSFRAKEAATRRLLGGTKVQLFANFITESVLLCLLSTIIAFLLCMLVEPIFNNIIGCKLSMVDSLTLQNITIALSGVLLLGAVSGIFPALIISQFKPIEVVRGNFKRRTKMVYSKVLISFQYLITIVMIGCAMVIIRQVDFMKNSNLGFERENILELNNNIGQRIWGLKDALVALPGVDEVSLVQGAPINGGNNFSMTINNANFSFQCFGGDSAMMKILNFEIVKTINNEVDSAVYITEMAWRKLGLKDGDSEFQFEQKKLAIRGVIKDFHFRDMSKPITESIIFSIAKDKRGLSGYESTPWSVLVKISGNNPAEIRKRIEKTYLEFNGNTPFKSFFWNDKVEQWYVSQQRISDIVGLLSLLSLLLSSLGILAMSTYFIRQRTKEIAIRKVFGSSASEMIVRLIKSFLLLIAFAFVVSIPIIWYLMTDWLKDYQYRIDITWEIMLIAGLLTFIVAILTLLWHSIEATHANPVKSLRD